MVGQLLYFWEDLLFRCYVSFREGSHWRHLHEEQCRVFTDCQPYPRMSILLLRAAAPPICSNLYLGGLHWRPTDAHSHTVGRVWGACEESTWLEGYVYSALSFSGHPSTCTFGANVVSRVLLTTWQQDDELMCLLGVPEISSFAWQQGRPVQFELMSVVSIRLVWLSATCLWAPREPVGICQYRPTQCFCRCCLLCHAREIQVCFGVRHGRVFPSKKRGQELKCVHPFFQHNLTRFRMTCWLAILSELLLHYVSLPYPRMSYGDFLPSNSPIRLQNGRSL